MRAASSKVAGRDMTESEFRAAWADLYPKWRTDADAANLCQSVYDLIVEAAKVSAILGTV